MASLLRRAFEGIGYAVDIAPDGEEGLWRARATTYDAILLDRMLPGIHGVLAASPRGKGPPLATGRRLRQALEGEARFERSEAVRFYGRSFHVDARSWSAHRWCSARRLSSR